MKSMKRTILVCGALAILAGSLFAGENPLLRTGTWWKKPKAEGAERASTIKNAYLMGFYEGYFFATERAWEGYSIPGEKTKDVLTGLDQFYSDPKNTNIPLAYAMGVMNMKASGEKKDKVERAVLERQLKWGE